MNRWVLHVDMDAFFASCEQLTRPTLRGRPVLVGGIGGRGVVAGCSYEARAKGAHSAMPMHQARRLVGPAAVVLPPRGSVYREASRRVFAVVRDLVDVVEQVSIDEAFLEPEELWGATAQGCAEWAEYLRATIREHTGLPASVGAGAGKQYAKIASGLAKPDGVRVIARRDHDTEIAPLSVRKLWGVGPVAGEKLARIGVETIGDLAALDEAEVSRELGKAVGASILAVARGYDDRPVHERAEAKQISAESTFATDLRTSAEVGQAVRRSAGHTHRRLLADGRHARTVTVKLKRADFTSVTRSATLPRGTTNYEVIAETAVALAPDPVEFGAVRLVGVSVSGLVEEYQGVLFGDDADDPSDDLAATPDAAPVDPVAGVDAPAVADTPTDTEIGATAVEDADLEGDTEVGPGPGSAVVVEPGTRHEAPPEGWRPGADVRHPEHGAGWVQGCGHGRVTVRFETRTTGPGRALTFAEDDPALTAADPLDALDW